MTIISEHLSALLTTFKLHFCVVDLLNKTQEGQKYEQSIKHKFHMYLK